QSLVDLLGQPLALHLFIEHVGPEEVLHVRLAEIDAVEVVLGGCDGLDRLLADGGHISLLSKSNRVRLIRRVRGKVAYLKNQSPEHNTKAAAARRGRSGYSSTKANPVRDAQLSTNASGAARDARIAGKTLKTCARIRQRVAGAFVS